MWNIIGFLGCKFNSHFERVLCYGGKGFIVLVKTGIFYCLGFAMKLMEKEKPERFG